MFQFPVVLRVIVLSAGANQMNDVCACIEIPGLQNCTFANCCKALSALAGREQNSKDRTNILFTSALEFNHLVEIRFRATDEHFLRLFRREGTCNCQLFAPDKCSKFWMKTRKMPDRGIIKPYRLGKKEYTTKP